MKTRRGKRSVVLYPLVYPSRGHFDPGGSRLQAPDCRLALATQSAFVCRAQSQQPFAECSSGARCRGQAAHQHVAQVYEMGVWWGRGRAAWEAMLQMCSQRFCCLVSSYLLCVCVCVHALIHASHNRVQIVFLFACGRVCLVQPITHSFPPHAGFQPGNQSATAATTALLLTSVFHILTRVLDAKINHTTTHTTASTANNVRVNVQPLFLYLFIHI